MITNGSKGKSPSSLRGFSLVELLVVVTIIAILSGLVIGVTGFVQRKAAVDRARTQLNLFSLKIEEYSADVGGLLPEEEDKTGIIIYRMLYGDGIGADGIAGTADDGAMDGRPDDGFSPYIADLDPNTNPQKWIDKEGREVPVKVVDPWGNAWHYRRLPGDPSMENPNNSYDLWSLGPDGKSDTPDDIKNW